MFKEQEKGNYPLRGGDKIEREELYGWKEKKSMEGNKSG